MEMDYSNMIEQERAKLELMRAKHSLLGTQIAASEDFIATLEKRSNDGGDALDKFLEQQLASTTTTKAALPQPLAPVLVQQPIEDYEFPKVRVDSSWPYVLRLMSTKPTCKLEELVSLCRREGLTNNESAVRSMMFSLKKWGMVDNDRPGVFTLKPKGAAFVSTLTASQFVFGGTAGTTQGANNA